MAKQDDYTRYTIRVPREAYAHLETAAREAGRSINAEIVDRLTYAIEHPRSEFRAMSIQIQEYDALLDDAEIKIEELTEKGNALGEIVNSGFESEKRLMYQVLNYLNEIPIELAIWAFDMIAIVERSEFMSHYSANTDLNVSEIKSLIAERRDARQEESLKAIRRYMGEQDPTDQSS